MKNWVQITELKDSGYCHKRKEFIKYDKPKHVPGIGSFQNISFDGRYSIDTIINLCFEYLENNKKFNYSGFIIHNAEWLKENKVYQYSNNHLN